MWDPIHTTLLIFSSLATRRENIKLFAAISVSKLREMSLGVIFSLISSYVASFSLPKLDAIIFLPRPMPSYALLPYMSPTLISIFEESPYRADSHISVGSVNMFMYLITPTANELPIVVPHTLLNESALSTTWKVAPLRRFASKYGYSDSFKLK